MVIRISEIYLIQSSYPNIIKREKVASKNTWKEIININSIIGNRGHLSKIEGMNIMNKISIIGDGVILIMINGRDRPTLLQEITKMKQNNKISKRLNKMIRIKDRIKLNNIKS